MLKCEARGCGTALLFVHVLVRVFSIVVVVVVVEVVVERERVANPDLGFAVRITWLQEIGLQEIVYNHWQVIIILVASA
jgi:hypothetical protein